MYSREYREKLTTPEAVAAKVQSGDYIKLGYFNGKPVTLIEALANRHEELTDVSLVGTAIVPPVPEVFKYPDSFNFIDWHWSKLTRMIREHVDNLSYAPVCYHACPEFVRNGTVCGGNEIKHVWQRVAPMDEHGYFNFGTNNSESLASFEIGKNRCVEVNKSTPICLGGNQESIHISMVDFIVEAPDDQQVFAAPEIPPPTDVEMKIANHLLDYIRNGSCLQLGIGGLPNAIGILLKDTDIKDLGVHSEMFVDAYIDMIDSGQINNSQKQIDRHKSTYTFALGTQRLYDWMNYNKGLASYNVDYINHPVVISRLDNMISINQALSVDLLTQISAESMGYKQITGNGGMTDFVIGAQWSRGGKSIICLPATHKDKDGNLVSRIVPTFPLGTSVTVSRHLVDYIATEYGVKKMKAQSQWARTEAIIELAHPQFRDDLIKAAQEAKIWRRSNKIE